MRLVRVTVPPCTAAIARMPSHFISNAQSSFSSMSLSAPSVASIGAIDAALRGEPTTVRRLTGFAGLAAVGALDDAASEFSSRAVSPCGFGAMRWMSQLLSLRPPRPPVWMSA